ATVALTRLTAQGLPALLPLGWSPLAAFDLRIGDTALAAPIHAAPIAGTGPFALARYDVLLHAWSVVAAGLTPASDHSLDFQASAGAYALVLADSADLVAQPGQPLPTVDMMPLPDTATSTVAFNPLT